MIDCVKGNFGDYFWSCSNETPGDCLARRARTEPSRASSKKEEAPVRRKEGGAK